MSIVAGFILLGIHGYAMADDNCVTTDDLFAKVEAYGARGVSGYVYPILSEQEDDRTFIVFRSLGVPDICQEALQGRAIHIAAGPAAVLVGGPDKLPSVMTLAVDIGDRGFALGVE